MLGGTARLGFGGGTPAGVGDAGGDLVLIGHERILHQGLEKRNA
jgi:hypothetical protein